MNNGVTLRRADSRPGKEENPAQSEIGIDTLLIEGV